VCATLVALLTEDTTVDFVPYSQLTLESL